MPGPPTVEQKIAASLQPIANGIDEALELVADERYGFALMVFPFNNADSHVQFVSNCDRKDIADVMRKLLARWDANLPTPALTKLPGLS